METETLQTDTSVEAPVVEAPPPDPQVSLLEHAQKSDPLTARMPGQQKTPSETVAKPAPPMRARDAKSGEFVPQRAASQRASAKDTDEIAELTKRLRQAEIESGLKFDRREGESDRAFALRQRAEIAEALRDARKASPRTAPQPEALQRERERATAPSQAQGKPFESPMPKPADFANTEEPFEAYTLALNQWQWNKNIHDAQQQILAQRDQQSHAAALKSAQDLDAKVQGHIDTFVKDHPDYHQVIEAVESIKVPDVLMVAIRNSDNPAQLAYALGKQPDDLIDMVGFSAALEYSPDSVEIVRRRLARYVRDTNAAGNGHSDALPPAPSPVVVAPRPPTSLGTGPLKTGEPTLRDGDIFAHAKKHDPRRRFQS